LGALATTPALAQAPRSAGGGGIPPGHRGMPPPSDAMLLPLLLRGANLTAEQDARVRTIISARQPTMRAVLEQLRRAEDDLADRLFGGAASGDVQAAVARISQLRDRLLQESARAALEVRAVLSPEQLGRAAYVKDRMRALQTDMRDLAESGRK
jgi:Spy/CpxP family protein refolding chaperone